MIKFLLFTQVQICVNWKINSHMSKSPSAKTKLLSTTFLSILEQIRGIYRCLLFLQVMLLWENCGLYCSSNTVQIYDQSAGNFRWPSAILVTMASSIISGNQSWAGALHSLVTGRFCDF